MTEHRNPTEDILMQADALMRRPRTFVAQHRGQSPEPAQVDDTDLPVLTDIVADSAHSPVAFSQGTEPAASDFSNLIEEELAAWVDTELPKAVLRITDGLADRLIEELGVDARTRLLEAIRHRLGQTGQG